MFSMVQTIWFLRCYLSYTYTMFYAGIYSTRLSKDNYKMFSHWINSLCLTGFCDLFVTQKCLFVQSLIHWSMFFFPGVTPVEFIFRRFKLRNAFYILLWTELYKGFKVTKCNAATKIIIFHTKPLSVHQTCKGSACIDSTNLINKGLNKILTLRKEPYLLRLQALCAAKFLPVPKLAACYKNV